MNQKDYKAIAEIIKGNMEENIGRLTKLPIRTINRNAIFHLADYFEREESERKLQDLCSTTNPKRDLEKIFNRKQFLKDCGVE